MQRNWFLGDLLDQLFERPGKKRGKDDKRSISELCEALLSAEGEVSGFALASTILDRYQTLDDPEKLDFFAYLNDQLELDADQLAEVASLYANDRSVNLYQKLSEFAEPKRQELLRRLNQPSGATQELVAMRARDALGEIRDGISDQLYHGADHEGRRDVCSNQGWGQ